MHWCKLYKSFASDPKIQSLPHDMQRHLIMLMCLHIDGAITNLDREEIRKYLGVTKSKFSQIFKKFREKNLINDQFELLNFGSPQLSSNPDAVRQRRHRESKKTTNLERDNRVTCHGIELELELELDKDIMSVERNHNVVTPEPKTEKALATNKDFLDELQEWFPPEKLLPTNLRFFRMMKRWSEEGVAREDLRQCLLLKQSHGNPVTNPLYFENMVIDYAKHKNDPPKRQETYNERVTRLAGEDFLAGRGIFANV